MLLHILVLASGVYCPMYDPDTPNDLAWFGVVAEPLGGETEIVSRTLNSRSTRRQALKQSSVHEQAVVRTRRSSQSSISLGLSQPSESFF